MEKTEELNVEELEIEKQESGEEIQEAGEGMRELNPDELEKVSGSSWLGNIWNKIKSAE